MTLSVCDISTGGCPSRGSTDSARADNEAERKSTTTFTISSGATLPQSCEDKTSPNVRLEKSCIVDFEEPDDPLRPMNWSLSKKVAHCFLYGLLDMGATWGTSSYAVAIPAVSRNFAVSNAVSTLGTSMFLFAFGIGPLLFAPLSEVFGRKIPSLVPYLIGICFTFGTVGAKDIETVLISRFFAGFFSSAPMAISGGVLSDLFSAQQRGTALAAYSIAVAAGPLLAPICGSALIIQGHAWQSTEVVTGIVMALGFGLALLFVRESDANMILTYKARRLRVQNGDWALHATHEEWEVGLKQLATKYLVVPLRLACTPICFLMSLYGSFVYAMIYLTFSAFPIEFSEIRGWNIFVSSLPYLSTLVGSFFGMIVNVANNTFYAKAVKANLGRPVPEARLPPMMLGGVAFAGGLFMFAYTSGTEHSWIGPVVGAGLIGFGFLTVFQAALNFLVDTFLQNAASAMASNVVIRCMVAGAFPLVADPMFDRLGVRWSMATLAFIASGLIPIPVLFYIFGRKIRAAGKLSRPSTL